MGLTDEQIRQDLPKIVSDSLAHDIDQEPTERTAEVRRVKVDQA